jgi:UDP-N-acetylmuramoyl-tripeptide--D-alanyl-D-alanine ligase
VEDTLKAYQDLAAAWLRRIRPVTVAVTGSVGKTSVKDMIAWVCRGSYRTVWSDKNYNNQVGVPRTILEADDDTEVLVLEMGMDHEGEIRRLAEIARPDIGVVTNVGISHRENFDDDDGIFRAKMELADYMGEGDLLVVNGDDPRLSRVANNRTVYYKTVTAGQGEGCDFRISEVHVTDEGGVTFLMENEGEMERFTLPVAGAYSGVNAGLAAAALSRLHVSLRKSAARLRELERTAQRLEIRKGAGFTVVDDTYNASPDSMRSGLEALVSMRGKRRIAILAGMRELGPASDDLHRQVGETAMALGVDLLIAVGEFAAEVAAGAEEIDAARVRYCRDKTEAADFLQSYVRREDVFLVKGSRAEHMEDIVDCLMTLTTKE